MGRFGGQRRAEGPRRGCPWALLLTATLGLVPLGCKESNTTIIEAAPGGGGGSGGGTGGEGGGPGGGNGGGPAVTVEADLVLVTVQTAVDMVEAGEALPVSFQVRNDGPDPVPAFRVGVYLSVDEILDAGDTLLESWVSQGLGPGTTFANGGLAQVPVSLTPGSYRLVAGADDLNGLNETDESNNAGVSSGPVEVLEPTLPDLVVESVTYGPMAIEAGETIDVSHSVRNVGVEAADGFRIGMYLSTDSLVDASDLLLGQRPVSSLAVGAADTGSGVVTVPTLVPAGVYHVGVVCDDQAQVLELSETNNGGAAAETIDISAAPLPDLVPTAFTVQQTEVDAGQPIVVDDTVLNQGAGVAPLFQVSVYLSDDADIDPAEDRLLGTRTVSQLAVGESSTSGPTAIPVPGSTPGGTWFVGVLVDAGEFAVELDETNNALVASGNLSITVPPLPDLVLNSFTVPGSGVQVRADGTDSLNVNYSVTNDGVAPSAPVEATLYFSVDAAVTTGDIPAGSVSIPALSPGSGAGQATSIPIPGGIDNGSYRVGLWVDALEVQPELDEGNNVLVATNLVDVIGGGPQAPNLVPDLIDPDRMTAAPGEMLQVVTRVVNSGDLSTPAFRVIVVLSSDETIEATDTRIGQRLVPFGLGGGFSSVASAPVTVPGTLPDGDYHIGVFADDQGVVVESSEEDNGLAATQIFRVRTPPPPSPNLVVTSVSASPPSPLLAGGVFDVPHEVRNVGDVDAGALRVGIYLSTDETIETSDLLLETRVLAALAAGGSSSATTSVQIPLGTAPGTYRIGVIVDDQNTVAEGDESDNVRRAAGDIVVE